MLLDAIMSFFTSSSSVKGACPLGPAASQIQIATDISKLQYQLLSRWICPTVFDSQRAVVSGSTNRMNPPADLRERLDKSVALLQLEPKFGNLSQLPILATAFLVDNKSGSTWLTAGHVAEYMKDRKTYVALNGDRSVVTDFRGEQRVVLDAPTVLAKQGQMNAESFRRDPALPFNLEKKSGIDLAELSSESVQFPQGHAPVSPLTVRDLEKEPLALGEPVFLAGREANGQLTIHPCSFRGLNSNLYKVRESLEYQINCPEIDLSAGESKSTYGFSGGPVVDSKGRAVAVFEGQTHSVPTHYFSATPLFANRRHVESHDLQFAAYPASSPGSVSCMPCFDHGASADDSDFMEGAHKDVHACVIGFKDATHIQLFNPGK